MELEKAEKMKKLCLIWGLLTIFLIGCNNQIDHKGAGESCVKNESCISNRCIEGKCDPSGKYENCTKDSDCTNTQFPYCHPNKKECRMFNSSQLKIKNLFS